MPRSYSVIRAGLVLFTGATVFARSAVGDIIVPRNPDEDLFIETCKPELQCDKAKTCRDDACAMLDKADSGYVARCVLEQHGLMSADWLYCPKDAATAEVCTVASQCPRHGITCAERGEEHLKCIRAANKKLLGDRYIKRCSAWSATPPQTIYCEAMELPAPTTVTPPEAPIKPPPRTALHVAIVAGLLAAGGIGTWLIRSRRRRNRKSPFDAK